MGEGRLADDYPVGHTLEGTVSRMLERNVAHDPTIAIHEHGLTAVNGEPAPMARAIIDHLPTNEQRSVKSELFGTESEEERAEYVAAFEFILDVLSRLNEQGVMLLPGTDLGGGIAYHRELELFGKIGLTPAEVLRRASYDMAVYLDQDEDLGSIEDGVAHAEAIGFEVTPLAARVRVGATSVRARTHMLLRVDLAEGPFVADVGFGADGPVRPLPLEEGREHWLGAVGHRFRREKDLWVLEGNARARRMYERRGWRVVPGRTATPEGAGIVEV